MRHSFTAIALVLAVVFGIFPVGSGSAFAASTLKARVLSIELPVTSSWDYVDGTAEYVGKHHSSIRPLVEAGANLYQALEELQSGIRTEQWPGNSHSMAASLVAQLSDVIADAKSLSKAGNISSVATALDALLKDQKALFPNLNTFNVDMGLPSFQVVVAVFDCQLDVKTVSTAIAAFEANNKSLTPTLPLLLSRAHGGPYLVGKPGLAPFYGISIINGRQYVAAPSSSRPTAASAKACEGAFA
jgi:hypothetical protein